MSYIRTLTQKGQVTLPKELRDFLGIRPTEKVGMFIDAVHGDVRIVAAKKLSSLAGAIRVKKAKNAVALRRQLERSYQRV